jgi:hypothetical protein
MKELIRYILKEEENENLKERFVRSAKSIPYIIQSNVDSNLITEIEIESINYNNRHNSINGELLITSWCEDPDLFEFTNQLKLVDKELDTVLLNYSFTSNGSFGKKKGKYNNMMFWFVGCEWSAEGDYTMKMKYHFTQEEYDDGE